LIYGSDENGLIRVAAACSLKSNEEHKRDVRGQVERCERFGCGFPSSGNIAGFVGVADAITIENGVYDSAPLRLIGDSASVLALVGIGDLGHGELTVV